MPPIVNKYVTIINHITKWFNIMQYNDNKVNSIANLVETLCLTIYLWPAEVTYIFVS